VVVGSPAIEQANVDVLLGSSCLSIRVQAADLGPSELLGQVSSIHRHWVALGLSDKQGVVSVLEVVWPPTGGLALPLGSLQNREEGTSTRKEKVHLSELHRYLVVLVVGHLVTSSLEEGEGDDVVWLSYSSIDVGEVIVHMVLVGLVEGSVVVVVVSQIPHVGSDVTRGIGRLDSWRVVPSVGRSEVCSSGDDLGGSSQALAGNSQGVVVGLRAQTSLVDVSEISIIESLVQLVIVVS